MIPTGMIPDAGMNYLTPLGRFERVRAAARSAEAAATKLEALGVYDNDARDAALEAHDEACTQIIDLLCDPAADEMFCGIEAYLQVAYGRAG